MVVVVEEAKPRRRLTQNNLEEPPAFARERFKITSQQQAAHFSSKVHAPSAVGKIKMAIHSQSPDPTGGRLGNPRCARY
jgi:hypothetical protein